MPSRALREFPDLHSLKNCLLQGSAEKERTKVTHRKELSGKAEQLP